MSNIMPFIDTYNWKERSFPSHEKIFKSLNRIISQMFCLLKILKKK